MPKKKTREEFIADARKKHGDKYDYSLVDYRGSDKKVRIICPKHGEFLQTPHSHIAGQECPACDASKATRAERRDYSISLTKLTQSMGTSMIIPKSL